MNHANHLAPPRWCTLIVSFCALVILFTGCLGIIGWQFGISAFLHFSPRWLPMAFNSAVCFVLNGLALWLLRQEHISAVRRSSAYLCAFATLIIAGLTLLQSFTGNNLGINTFFFSNSLSIVNPMLPYTAINHALVAIVLLLLDVKKIIAWILQVFDLYIFMTAVFAFLGYLYQMDGLANHLAMSFNTSILFILFSVGLLLARPTHGFTYLLVKHNIAGQTLRRGLPFIFILPIIVGLFIYKPLPKTAFNFEANLPTIICGIILLFTILTWIHARTLNLLIKKLNKTKAKLRRAKEIAEEASNFKSRFLTKISHDLRTPLNGIIGFAEMIYHGKVGPVSAEHKEYIGDILASARQLQLLIDDVLDLAKVEAGKMEFHPERVNLQTVFGELPQIFKTLIDSKKIHFSTSVDPRLGEMIIDPVKLKQVIYNYASNALKCTPDNGSVTIRATVVEGDKFRLEVEDTGIGIRKADISRLFIEFQQLDHAIAKKYASTGLGLAIVRHIVEAQGGEVGVKSTFGKGSLFYATLPYLSANAPAAKKKSRHSDN